MPGQAKSSRNVFLNFPFDTRYENLYLALIAGVTAVGLTPRCVLEIKTTRDRLTRLLDLIAKCQCSVHDLSRVQLTPDAPRCPRFNMPFELGLTLARPGKLGRGHYWIVLEETPYRIQKSLSDLNGYDPFIHNGRVTGMLQALNDAFEQPARDVSVAEMKIIYKLLRTFASRLQSANDWSDLYRLSAFRQLVLAAKEISAGLMP